MSDPGSGRLRPRSNHAVLPAATRHTGLLNVLTTVSTCAPSQGLHLIQLGGPRTTCSKDVRDGVGVPVIRNIAALLFDDHGPAAGTGHRGHLFQVRDQCLVFAQDIFPKVSR